MNQFTNGQADINRLVSQLRIKIRPRYLNFKQPQGPEGRLKIMRTMVTALFKYERLELNYIGADEARGYAERLISEAIRHGDTHRPTVEMADYWLTEKALVHKLFKVIVPRFVNYNSSYTSLFKAPLNYPESIVGRSILELKGNPFPPLIFDGSRNKNLIHNILLEEARKEFKKSKQAEIIAKISSSEKNNASSSVSLKKDDDVLSKAAVEVSEGEQLLKSSSVENVDPKECEKSDSITDLNTIDNPVVA